MEQAELRYYVTPDGQEVTIETLVSGEQQGSPLSFDASSLEAFICGLGDVRASLPEQVPTSLDAGSRLPALINQLCYVEPVGARNQVSMAIRHPGFGWLGYLYPPEEARKIGLALIASADQLEGKAGSAGLTPTPPVPARGLPGLTGAAPPINIASLLPPRKA